MAQCEMCGQDSQLIDAIVEGTMLSVCKNCAKFGHVIAVQKQQETVRPRKLEITKEVPIDEEIDSIVPDYPLLIRKARERKEMKQEDLAKVMAEKESVIQKVESGHLEPPFDLAKKFEQFLGIKLIEKTKQAFEKKEINMDDSSLTIGDLIKFKN